MSKPQIVYRPRSDATPEGELSALATAYKFLFFERTASKGGSPAVTAPGARKEINGSGKSIIRQG